MEANPTNVGTVTNGDGSCGGGHHGANGSERVVVAAAAVVRSTDAATSGSARRLEGPSPLPLERALADWQRDLLDPSLRVRSTTGDTVDLELSAASAAWRLDEVGERPPPQRDGTKANVDAASASPPQTQQQQQRLYPIDSDYLDLRLEQNERAANRKLEQGRAAATAGDLVAARNCFAEGLDLVPDHADLLQATRELLQQQQALLVQQQVSTTTTVRPKQRSGLTEKSAQALQNALLERALEDGQRMPNGSEDGAYPLLQSSDEDEGGQKKRSRESKAKKQRSKKQHRKTKKRRRRRDSSSENEDLSSSVASTSDHSSESDSDAHRRRQRRKRRRNKRRRGRRKRGDDNDDNCGDDDDDDGTVDSCLVTRRRRTERFRRKSRRDEGAQLAGYSNGRDSDVAPATVDSRR